MWCSELLKLFNYQSKVQASAKVWVERQVSLPNQIFVHFYWSLVDLQCCVKFRCIAKWISYTYINFFYLLSIYSSLQSIEKSSNLSYSGDQAISGTIIHVLYELSYMYFMNYHTCTLWRKMCESLNLDNQWNVSSIIR